MGKTRIFYKCILALIFLCFCSRPLFAQEFQNEERMPTLIERPEVFGLVQDVYIEFSDQAVNNCWTSASTLKSKAKLIFEQSNIPVMEEADAFMTAFHPTISLTVLGQRDARGCWGFVSANFYVFESIEYGSMLVNDDVESHYYTNFYPLSLYEQQSAIISPSNFNQQVTDFFEGFVSEVAAKVIAGRRKPVIKNILEQYPQYIRRVPVSEFEKFMQLQSAE